MRFIAGENQKDNKLECRGKWFISIIRAILQVVKFLAGSYLRRALKMRTIIGISRARPPAMITHAQSGFSGCGAGCAGGADGAASVLKLKVADQSLGAGSSAITFQK